LDISRKDLKPGEGRPLAAVAFLESGQLCAKNRVLFPHALGFSLAASSVFAKSFERLFTIGCARCLSARRVAGCGHDSHAPVLPRASGAPVPDGKYRYANGPADLFGGAALFMIEETASFSRCCCNCRKRSDSIREPQSGAAGLPVRRPSRRAGVLLLSCVSYRAVHASGRGGGGFLAATGQHPAVVAFAIRSRK